MFDLHPLTWLLIAVAILLLIGASVTARCSAWTTRGTRCLNIAGGPFNRCHKHPCEIVMHDFLGALLIAGCIAGGLYWFNDGGLDVMLTDIETLTRKQ